MHGLPWSLKYIDQKNHTLQGDKTVVAGLDFIFDLAKKQGKKFHKPWVVRTDVREMDSDPAHEKVACENAAPVLFLYFDAASDFQGAVICADNHKVVIDTCVSNAVLSYVSLFHVCQVGYNESWMNFLNTLEHLLLGLEFKSTSKYTPIRLEKFLSTFKAEEN